MQTKSKLKVFSSIPALRKCLIECRKCPRLVRYRETVPEKKKFEGMEHWRKPVPGFGDEKAWLLILGLAPSSQGGNRTGRIFTGDESAKFLFKVLHAEKFAELSTSVSANDEQKLKGCYLTAAVKCVPPDNLPEKKETHNCSVYLWNEMHLLKQISSVLVLGKFAMDAYLWYVKHEGGKVGKVRFRHGGKEEIVGFPTLYMCYHPSPQNTNTGKLTEKMMRQILQDIREDQDQK